MGSDSGSEKITGQPAGVTQLTAEELLAAWLLAIGHGTDEFLARELGTNLGHANCLLWTEAVRTKAASIKRERDLAARFKELAPRAIDALSETLSSERGSEKVAAAREVLDRELGKPRGSHEGEQIANLAMKALEMAQEERAQRRLLQAGTASSTNDRKDILAEARDVSPPVNELKEWVNENG